MRANFPVSRSNGRQFLYNEIYQTPTDIAEHLLREVAITDLRPMLGDVQVPALIVHGRKSVVPVGVCEWLVSALPDARCSVINDAGHAPFWDQPGPFNAAV